MNNDNVDRMRRGYEAFGKGDLDTLRELFSPDIVWHNGGNNPLTGDYKGVDEVFGMLGKLFEMTNGDMTIEVHDLLANDEHGVAIVRFRGARPDGRTIETNEVDVFHIDGNGRVAEVWLVPEDAEGTDAFFA